jgi:hypothetical protein
MNNNNRFLKAHEIHVGEIWKGHSGNFEVEITKVENGWVEYKWEEKGRTVYHEKDAWCFQVRYGRKSK